MITDNISDHINALFEQEDWETARRLIVTNLDKLDPTDWMRHWWLTRLSTTYYEERDYAKALEVASDAYAIAPNCPLVMWDYAGALDMVDAKGRAALIYHRMLILGARRLGADQCGEGILWAEGIITDVWYRRGLCLKYLGKTKTATDCAEQVRSRLKEGKGGIYTQDDMTDLLGVTRPEGLSNLGILWNPEVSTAIKVKLLEITPMGNQPLRGSGERIPSIPWEYHPILTASPSSTSPLVPLVAVAGAKPSMAYGYTSASSSYHEGGHYTNIIPLPRTIGRGQVVC